ncbi:hypothetical protein R69927_05938 [Paraburkholderia domus]|nr:hypothetical protein R69927_05938 [Paraburkholderia domus]
MDGDDEPPAADAIGDAPVAILGSSFIGLETASALRKRGTRVTVISPEKIPFARQFGEHAGAMFRELHERNGVVFRLETEVSSLEGALSR